MKTKFKYIEMTRQPQTGTTEVWRVENSKRGYILGKIAWYGAFRQYSFFPAGGGLVFSDGCMNDICEFIRELKKQYREEKVLGQP